MRTLKVLLPLAVLAALAATLAGSTARADDGDLAILGNKLSIAMANAGQGHGKGHHGKGVASEFECTSSGAGNVQLDCDDPFPNNEPNLVVDPANPLHMIASSNDYGSCCDEWYTTFDGGATWATGNISTEAGGPTGSDPVTSFDTKHHVALHASLNYFFNDDFTETCDGDVVVSPSKDGGLKWDPPVVVDDGVGCDLDKKQLFDDKEWISTDNNKHSKFYGRTYLTWTQFESHNGEFVRSPILESHSDDGGKHWSKAQEIDGSSKDLCTFQTAGHDGQCDEGTGSTSTVAPDGTVYVAFLNPQNEVALGARRGVRRPVPRRQVEGRRRALVQADVRCEPRGRDERLPAERGRAADAQRLPGARLVARQHRRQPDRRDALHHVLGQPKRPPRRREPGDEHRRVRRQLERQRQDVE